MAEERKQPTGQTQQPNGPASTMFNVMVRHSSFILKNADIEAVSEADAKQKFLALVKAKHDKRAAQIAEQHGLDAQTIAMTQKAIREAFSNGVKAVGGGESELIIRPKADVDAERAKLKEMQAKA